MCHFALEDDVLCIVHHPTLPQFSLSLVTGHVFAYAYTPGDLSSRSLLWSTKRHKKACRALCYSATGDALVSAGADGVIKLAASQTGKVSRKWTSTHADPINVVQFINEDTFCTGDDGGVILAWSVSRGDVSTRSFATHDDYISCLLPLDSKFVLSTSGDGTLAVHDLRENRFSNDEARAAREGWTRMSGACLKRSDDQEDDLTGVVCLSRGKREKLLVGTAGGVVSIFDRGDIGDCNDRVLPPPPLTASTKKKKRKKGGEEEEIGVECLAKVDDRTVLVGGSDGVVRLLQVLPNRYLRVVGDFETGEPIEGLVVRDGWVIVVSGQDVRSWPIEETESVARDSSTAQKVDISDGSDTRDDDGEDENDSNDGESDKGESTKDENDVRKPDTNGNDDDEDDGVSLVDDEEDGDQFSDSDSDAPKRKKPKKTKPVMTGKKNTFFDDLS